MATRRRSRRKSISGNLTDIQKRIRYLETRPAAGRLASKAVATRNLALRAVEEDAVADNAIIRRSIAAAAVGTGQIEQDSITNALIATNAVNADSIEAGAVGTTEIATDAVTTDKVATDAITNNEIATNAVNNDSIAPGSVGTDELAFGAVTTDKIGSSQVTDEKISGISGSKIIGGVDGDLIVNGSIEAIKIAGVNSTVLIGQIQDAQIEELDGSKIITGSLPAEAIEPESITEDQMGTDSVGFDELQFNSVAYAQIQENAVGELSIDSLAIARRHMQDNVIIARMINAGAVETAKIQNLAVTGGKIANGTIDSTKLGGIGSAVFNSLGLQAPIGGFFGQGFANLRISVGSGATQVAAGNHTHGQGGYTAAGSTGVPSHTHPASISIGGSANTGGGHTGHAGHGHSLTLNASVTTQAPSSLKLKKEISDYQPADIKNILNLKLKKYKYKNQLRNLHEGVNREWMHGYIAEEVLELGFEELLGYDEKGEPASLNYGLLSTLVLELVKVQQTEIDSLKEEIQRLKEKI
jgi:hypothetical protein